MHFSKARTVPQALIIAVGWLIVANIGIIAAGYCRQRSLQDAAPLFAAVERGEGENVSRLLDLGAPVDARRFSSDPEVTEYYQRIKTWLRIETWLRYRDYPYSSGYTPLMIASLRGDEAMARLLIARGADCRATEGREGGTPVDLARGYGHPKLADYLDRVAQNQTKKP